MRAAAAPAVMNPQDVMEPQAWPPSTVLNIAAYRFVALNDLPALRERLLSTATTLQLKGTVLLAQEGINLVLAGAPQAVRRWLQGLYGDARFAGLKPKESHSAGQPFQRLKVKIKREIIRMDSPQVRPETGRAPVVDATTLARWLAQGHCDAGRPLLLLDTRNRFEVQAGRFEGAVDWGLERFGEFPAALQQHQPELAGHTVVSYCTGGIRCEKAVLHMQQLGVANSYQLEGGILQYFEDTAGAAPGWSGRCVVFDERDSLDTQLAAPAAPAVSDALGANGQSSRASAP